MDLFKRNVIYRVSVSKLKKPKRGELFLFKFPSEVDQGTLERFREHLQIAMNEKKGCFLVTSGDYEIISLKNGKHKIRRIKN